MGKHHTTWRAPAALVAVADQAAAALRLLADLATTTRDENGYSR